MKYEQIANYQIEHYPRWIPMMRWIHMNSYESTEGQTEGQTEGPADRRMIFNLINEKWNNELLEIVKIVKNCTKAIKLWVFPVYVVAGKPQMLDEQTENTRDEMSENRASERISEWTHEQVSAQLC